MTDSPTISLDEYMAELDRLRDPNFTHPAVLLTDEQYELLNHARENQIPVKWDTLTRWFNKTYHADLKMTTLRNRYFLEKSRREPSP